MSDLSKDAIAEAKRLYLQANDPSGPGALGIAAALQRHMDRAEQERGFAESAAMDRDRAREQIDDLSRELTEEIDEHRATRENLGAARARAEMAEDALVELRATSIEKLRFEESARADAAEARVKELERCCEIADEAMDQACKDADTSEASKAALIAELGAWMGEAATDKFTAWTTLYAIIEKYRGQP